MSFETDLFAHLQADAAISAIVNDRIYPLIIPERAPDLCVTYTIVFGNPENSLDGYTSGKRRISVQLDCWSQSYAAMRRLADAVRDRMGVAAANFTGLVTEYPALDDYEEDTKRYRRSIGCSCWFSE